MDISNFIIMVVVVVLVFSWLSCVEFDNEKFWDYKDNLKVHVALQVPEPLASDSRFRQDSIYLAQDNIGKGPSLSPSLLLSC